MSPFDLQTALHAEGCYSGPLDGIWGPQSIAALTQFQAEQGLPQSRQADAATIAALELAVHQTPGVPQPVDAAALVAEWESVGDGDHSTELLEPYFDGGGVATIGFGHVIRDENGQRIQAAYKGDPKARDAALRAAGRLWGHPAISLLEAKSLLSVDVNAFAGQIAPLLHGVPTTQAQFDAMTCLAFNIGGRGFSGSSVLARHRAGVPVSKVVNIAWQREMSRTDKMDATMEGAFTAWSKDGGVWVLGLFRRRLCEALVYRGDPISSAVAAARRTA